MYKLLSFHFCVCVEQRSKSATVSRGVSVQSRLQSRAISLFAYFVQWDFEVVASCGEVVDSLS